MSGKIKRGLRLEQPHTTAGVASNTSRTRHFPVTVADGACRSTVHTVKKKVKQSLYRPGGFQEVKVPRFRDNGTGWW